MEYENVNEVPLTRDEACKEVKKIAGSIEKIIRRNYLNIMSAEDKNAIKELYAEINETATANGVTGTAKATIEGIKRKFGESSDSLGEEISLDKFKGAVDAQAEATINLKWENAKRCQGRAKEIFSGLSESDKAEAYEYRRGKFEELTISIEQVEQNSEKIIQKYKGCLESKSASERQNMTNQINLFIRGRSGVGIFAGRE